MIDIRKDFAELIFITPFLVEVNTDFVIMDTGTKGAKDISMAVLVPGGGELDAERLAISLYRKGTNEVEPLEMGTDYEVVEREMVEIRNFGENSLKEVRSKLEVLGLGFGMNLDL